MAHKAGKTKKSKASNHLVDRLRKYAQAGEYLELLVETPLVVGVSGGPDSVALLSTLVELRGEHSTSTLKIAHLNHGLRGEEALADALLVEKLARILRIECFTGAADVHSYAQAEKLSIEDAARRARYAFFREVARRLGGEWAVAVAHTADDQAETVLMSILRGTGLAGLAGMQPVSRLHVEEQSVEEPIILVRPLLSTWRQEIIAYLEERNLPFNLDASNLDRSFTRNRVRHDLLPLLARDYNPAIKARLVALARIAHVDDSYIESEVDRAWAEVARISDDGQAITFDASYFSHLHHALRLRVVRRAISLLLGSARDLDYEHTLEAASILASNREGEVHLAHGIVAESRQAWSGIRLATSEVTLELALREYSQGWPIISPGSFEEIKPGSRISLEWGWRLEASIAGGSEAEWGEYSASFDMEALGRDTRLTIRARRGGDRIEPWGMEGKSKSLQDLLVDAKIPSTIRDRLALVADSESGEVLWVPGPGGRRSRKARVTSETKRILQLRFYREQMESESV